MVLSALTELNYIYINKQIFPLSLYWDNVADKTGWEEDFQ